jgi:hypothetical protein
VFKERLRGYALHMNERAVSTGPGGYLFAFSISRASLRLTGLCAVSAVVVGAALATATEPFRIPLGIALGATAATLLIAYAVSRSSRGDKPEPASTPAGRGGHRATGIGKLGRKKSVASELALLADLHSRGALSAHEFTAAKRRILGS